MKVAIVGAGVCGLAAARTLKQSGIEVVLFEKNKRVGGRVSTYRQDGFIWDTGATSIAPRGKAIEQVILHELDTSELVQVEKPVYLHHALRVTPGDRHVQTTRYTYRDGIATFPRLLSEGLDIRLDNQVETISRKGEGFTIEGEDFDAVILTPPIPRSAALLWALDESRPIASVFYRSCINVALGYDIELPPVNYFAILDPDQRFPLTWLSLESVKSPGRCPEGSSAMCAQLSPQTSLERYMATDEELVKLTCFFIAKLYGEAFAVPTVSTIKRWKYSQPERFVSVDDANPAGTRLFIASDGLMGGHTEDAYDVGKNVAERIIASMA